jgi:hypothetical protein
LNSSLSTAFAISGEVNSSPTCSAVAGGNDSGGGSGGLDVLMESRWGPMVSGKTLNEQTEIKRDTGNNAFSSFRFRQSFSLSTTMAPG